MISHDTTVFVIDSELETRRAVATLVEEMGFRCEAQAVASEFLSRFSPQTSGCVVLEMVLPDASGLHLLNRLADCGQPPMPVIFLTAHGSVRTTVQAMRGGAMHVFEKPLPHDELREAIYEAVLVDRDRRRLRQWHESVRSRLENLTVKEEQVLALMGRAWSSRQIAAELGVSVRTVELRRAKVMKKLGVQKVPQLERLSRQFGYVGSSETFGFQPETTAFLGGNSETVGT